MSLINKIKAIFEAEKVNAAADTIFVKTQDGQIFLVKGPELALDVEIVSVDEAGVEQPIVDGEYTLEDTTVITVTAGKVAEISTADEEAEDVAEGETPVKAEEVATEAIPAGDYILQDGSTITVDENQVVIAYVKAADVAPEAKAPEAKAPEAKAPEVKAEAMSTINEKLELKVAKLEAELKMSKEAFDKVNSQPAVKAIDKKKFEKTEVKSQSTMLSRVSEIMNKNK